MTLDTFFRRLRKLRRLPWRVRENGELRWMIPMRCPLCPIWALQYFGEQPTQMPIDDRLHIMRAADYRMLDLGNEERRLHARMLTALGLREQK